MRAPAKRYMRSGSARQVFPPPNVSECVAMLIESHKAMREAEQLRWDRLRARSWFGRLLWKLFGRWL